MNHQPLWLTSRLVRQGAEITLSALLDSGADATIIPITTLQATEARYVETRQMRGIVDTAYPVDLYLVTVRIGPHTIPAIRAVAAASNTEPIVGRDVLNQLTLTLNGPANVTELTA